MNTEKIKSRFQFVTSNINEIKMSNDFVIFPDETELHKSFDVEYEIIDASKMKETDKFFGLIKMTVNAELKDKEGKVFEIGLTLTGAFIDEDNLSIDEFKSMLSLNGCAALYGVARSVIINISSQSAVNAQIILPMVNFFKMKEERAEKEES